GGERTEVALLRGPIDEQEAAFVVRNLMPLRDVGVPEDVVPGERAAGPEDDRESVVRGERGQLDELGDPAREETGEDRIARTRGLGGVLGAAHTFDPPGAHEAC